MGELNLCMAYHRATAVPSMAATKRINLNFTIEILYTLYKCRNKTKNEHSAAVLHLRLSLSINEAETRVRLAAVLLKTHDVPCQRAS